MSKSESPVPHLTTSLSGPLMHLEEQFINHQAKIESWFREQWRITQAPFYSSVDIRNAGYKIAPVDTNLFPAGFNNLNPEFESLCIQAIQQAVERIDKPVDRIILIPENHTRNKFYLTNVAVLASLISKAGFEIKLGSLMNDLTEPVSIPLDQGEEVTLYPVMRNDNQIYVSDGFYPDLILLNNDLSAGRPDILENLTQTITPPLSLGWSNRMKSDHFKNYQEVANEFSSIFDLDPWLITPLYRSCGEIDFMKREGNSCLESNVNALLSAVQQKYQEYNIEQRPYVVVKAESGTYGMSVMTAHSAEELLELNRKERTRMSTTKEGQKVTRVLIQEGVFTNETWGPDKTVAEPVVYSIDKNVVGGFYRVHSKKGVNENLNSPGMRFEPLAFDDCCISPDIDQSPDSHVNRFYIYGVIARLATLAAAREIVEGSVES